MTPLQTPAPRFSGLAALFLACVAPAFLHAQQPPVASAPPGSARVASLSVTGSKKFSSETIAKLCGVEPGALVTREDIQALADRLAGLGWFNNVQYKFNTKREGVQIEFTLEDAPAVPAAFDDFPWFTDQELAETIRAETGLFDGTAPEGGEALDKMKQALQKFVAAHGIRGEVESTLLAAPGESGMIQQFRLNGPLVKVGAVEFSDPLPRNDRRITERMPDMIGKPYSRLALELFAYEQVRPVYLSKGFLRVHFGAPETRFTGDPKQTSSETVAVRLAIETGPLYKWDGVTWSGNSAFNSALLSEIVGLSPGDPADGVRIEGAWNRIATEYGKRGYIDAKIDPQPVFDEAASKAAYRVAITEGIQYRVGQMVITGLSLAAERQLLAAWALPRGEVFNKQYFDDFVATGARKIFENSVVHFERVGHLLQPHPDTKLVDILLDFQ
jgi:outer membrane protein assembly factor BamA